MLSCSDTTTEVIWQCANQQETLSKLLDQYGLDLINFNTTQKMAHGYIYILINKAMPGVVKVGKTTNDPSTRASQLSSATGVPDKFSIFRHYEVVDCDEAEAFSHRILERVFGRPNLQREFFSGDADQVATLLDDALSKYVTAPDPIDLSLFQPIIGRVLKKEFTMARGEFEEVFRQLAISEEKLRSSSILITAAGAYLACCFATAVPPYHPCIIGATIKAQVMSKAIDFASDFERDPTNLLIAFVRGLQ